MQHFKFLITIGLFFLSSCISSNNRHCTFSIGDNLTSDSGEHIGKIDEYIGGCIYRVSLITTSAGGYNIYYTDTLRQSEIIELLQDGR